MHDNQFSGVIPEEICNFDIEFSHIDYFNIGNNKFCPPYPDCLMIGEEFIDADGNGVWDNKEQFTDGNGIWDEGEEFTDEGNGFWDEGEDFIDEQNVIWDEVEDFIDENGNGIWDDAEEFFDSNNNGQYDSDSIGLQDTSECTEQ